MNVPSPQDTFPLPCEDHAVAAAKGYGLLFCLFPPALQPSQTFAVLPLKKNTSAGNHSSGPSLFQPFEDYGYVQAPHSQTYQKEKAESDQWFPPAVLPNHIWTHQLQTGALSGYFAPPDLI